MPISFQPVTKDNWRALHRLTRSLSAEQQRFVAPNTYSILEALYEPETYTTQAIYAGETPVGLIMTGHDERGRDWIVRLMIGADFQGKGYGRDAMKLAIERFKADPGCRAVYISFEPENHVARGLYASLGFIDTGTIEEDEVVYRLALPQEKPS